jgi:hypothetical protein
MKWCEVALVFSLLISCSMAEERPETKDTSFYNLNNFVSVRLEGHKKWCSAEDLPKGTVLLIEFSSSLHNSITHQRLDSPPYTVLITVENPSGHVITRQNFTKPSSRMFVTAAEHGWHFVCFQAILGQYMPNVYISLWPEVFLGEEGDSRITSPMVSQLHKHAYELSKTGGQIKEARREQELQLQRETEFRAYSESLCRMVVWMAILQTTLVILAAAGQAWTLRGFFRSKKLV